MELLREASWKRVYLRSVHTLSRVVTNSICARSAVGEDQLKIPAAYTLVLIHVCRILIILSLVPDCSRDTITDELLSELVVRQYHVLPNKVTTVTRQDDEPMSRMSRSQEY
jgi:hypothetical protein